MSLSVQKYEDIIDCIIPDNKKSRLFIVDGKYVLKYRDNDGSIKEIYSDIVESNRKAANQLQRRELTKLAQRKKTIANRFKGKHKSRLYVENGLWVFEYINEQGELIVDHTNILEQNKIDAVKYKNRIMIGVKRIKARKGVSTLAKRGYFIPKDPKIKKAHKEIEDKHNTEIIKILVKQHPSVPKIHLVEDIKKGKKIDIPQKITKKTFILVDGMVNVNFNNHPELIQRLAEGASSNFRTIEQEILYIVNSYLNGDF
jgi:hypothetical protein